jgi:hypothetical protein
VQGYYRRADANMVLGKHKDAAKDFQRAAKGAKSDPDLKRKLAACQKELQRQRFAKAVSRALATLFPVLSCHLAYTHPTAWHLAQHCASGCHC